MKPEDCINRRGVSAGDEYYDLCEVNEGRLCILWGYDACDEFEDKNKEEE